MKMRLPESFIPDMTGVHVRCCGNWERHQGLGAEWGGGQQRKDSVRMHQEWVFYKTETSREGRAAGTWLGNNFQPPKLWEKTTLLCRLQVWVNL